MEAKFIWQESHIKNLKEQQLKIVNWELVDCEQLEKTIKDLLWITEIRSMNYFREEMIWYDEVEKRIKELKLKWKDLQQALDYYKNQPWHKYLVKAMKTWW